jgi:hypothetical protein
MSVGTRNVCSKDDGTHNTFPYNRAAISRLGLKDIALYRFSWFFLKFGHLRFVLYTKNNLFDLPSSFWLILLHVCP